MSFARARALRSLHGSFRQTTGVRVTPRFSVPRQTQLTVTKRFASGGGAHGHAEPSSDIPWLVGGIAVTVPACWYLWPESGHAEHHDAHAEHDEEEHEEKEDDAPADDEEAPQEESEPEEGQEDQESDDKKEEKSDDKKEEMSSGKDEGKSDDKDEGKSDDKQKGKSEGKSEDKPEEGEQKSDDDGDESDNESDEQEKPESGKKGSGEGGSDRTGVGKGKGKNLEDTRQREPDSKGGFKKRIDSSLRKELGKGPDVDPETGDDNDATSKQPQKGKSGEMSAKQFGLSTTATRHSTQIDQDPEKSKKGDGSPETAKAMGTVDVNRPGR